MKLVITGEHHESFPFWHDPKLRGARLVHVDAHHDLRDGAPAAVGEPYGYVDAIDCGNFICPAVHEGIVEDMYWVNPHTEHTHYFTPFDLRTMVEPNGRLNWFHTRFKEPQGERAFSLVARTPLILDVDLDAFACHRHVHGVMYSPYDAVEGWRDRIAWTMELLKGIKPDLVTITRSQGRYARTTYVPPNLVDEVENAFMVAYRERR